MCSLCEAQVDLRTCALRGDLLRAGGTSEFQDGLEALQLVAGDIKIERKISFPM